MSETVLDRAHARLIAAGESDAALRAWYTAIAAVDLVMPLDAEPAAGAPVRPLVLETDDGALALAFDSDTRLADFMGGASAVATLPGRDLAAGLLPLGVGLLLNPDAPWAMLLQGDELAWIAEAAGQAAQAVDGRIVGVMPPVPLPDGLLDAVDAALAGAMGVEAILVRAAYDGGSDGLALGLRGLAADRVAPLAETLATSLRAHGLAGEVLDVMALPDAGPLAERMAAVGLVRSAVETPPAPKGPGMDPDAPPVLKY